MHLLGYEETVHYFTLKLLIKYSESLHGFNRLLIGQYIDIVSFSLQLK